MAGGHDDARDQEFAGEGSGEGDPEGNRSLDRARGGPRRHGPERERQDDPRAGPGRALGLRGHGGHGSVPRQGSARDEAGGPRPGRRLHGVPIPGRDPRREQRVFPQGGPERDPEVPRARGDRYDGFHGPRPRQGEAPRPGRDVHEARVERRLLRRREEEKRSLPDGRPRAEVLYPGRDGFRARHRRLAPRRKWSEHDARPEPSDARRDPLPTPPRLRDPRLRPRPRGWADREERRRGPGAEPGEARLRLDRRRGAEAAAGSRLRPGDIVAVALDAKQTYVADFASAEADLPSPSWLPGNRRAAVQPFRAAGLPPRPHAESEFPD